MQVALYLLMLLTAAPSDAPRPTVAELNRKASEAQAAGDLKEYLNNIEQIHTELPWHPAVQFALARAYALNGRTVDAVKMLDALADAGFGYPTEEAAFNAVRSDATFGAVRERLTSNAAPRGAVKVFASLQAAGRQPEAVVAWRDKFLVGTFASGEIIVVDGRGGRTAKSIVNKGWGLLGLRLNEAGTQLFACANNEATGESKLLRIRLRDFATVEERRIPAERALCNDITLISAGRLALTDSVGGKVWLYDRGALSQLKVDRSLSYPNGLAYDRARRRLYVAHGPGILAVDPSTGASAPIVDGSGTSGVDGLILEKDTLYAVQSLYRPVRILRVQFGPQGSAQVTTLASGHAELEGATTLTIRGKRAFILAHSGIPKGSQPDNPQLVSINLP